MPEREPPAPPQPPDGPSDSSDEAPDRDAFPLETPREMPPGSVLWHAPHGALTKVVAWIIIVGFLLCVAGLVVVLVVNLTGAVPK